ncbi:MAG: hypothetical protein ACP5HM_13580 [Anaerolineae bacterium]
MKHERRGMGMSEERYLEIIDAEGWRKEFPLPGRIAHVGSAPGNTIVLPASRGGGVAARHLQFIFPETGGCRLVNLGDTEIGLEGDRTLAPHATMRVGSGQRLQVGAFTLVLRFDAGEGSSEARPTPVTSRSIGLRIALPTTQLTPTQPIEGAVVVRNAGAQPGVQFHLTLEGLPAACYELGPAPLLFPNAEKSVSLRLIHPRGPTPRAGVQRFTVRATAPAAYPDERAEASQQIEVVPFYAHTLELKKVSHG